jgi:tRNA modification GTPase
MDTICAIATGTGGAISIIRVSGKQAIEIVNAIFTKNILEAKTHSIHHGFIIEPEAQNGLIDEVVVSVFRAPHSYTGENSVEIACHGSKYILNKVIELLIRQGCCVANPGEFTQRAFLNNKLDLSQAEAVADLIASSNRATHQMALSQLRGHFSSELTQLRQQLLKLTSLLELELDFSDHEDLEFADRKELLTLGRKIEERITQLANSYIKGQYIKHGIPVVLVGKTNVGKSSLLNRLLKDDRAIVSDQHGTTRDTIEDTLDINGISFRFIDTAGLRKTKNKIEQMGIQRTQMAINKALIVLWIIDKQPTKGEIQKMQELSSGKKLIIVQNKIDVSDPIDSNCFLPYAVNLIHFSAKQNKNTDIIENAIFNAAGIGNYKDNEIIVSNARHYDVLTKANVSIKEVINGLQQQLSGDLIAEDLRKTIDILSEITGEQITSDEVLSNIFKHFCIGK